MFRKAKFEVGVDEVGRGPLAGPIALCALIIKNKKVLTQFPKNCDSKHFSAKKRNELYKTLVEEKKRQNIDFAVSYAQPKYIDRWGIEKATRTALSANLRKLTLDPKKVEILLDGRLRAPDEYSNQKTFIKGDARIQTIGLASIVAKVERDKKMTGLAKIYPQYGFEKNMGYGTKYHVDAVRKYGLTPIHRLSFLKNILA